MANDKLIAKVKTLLVPKNELKKKQVALFLTQDTIDNLDRVVKELSTYSNGKVNRNILIEMAIDNLIESVPTIISEYESENNTIEEHNWDSILVPSQISGIEFMEKHNYWEYVKINPEKIPYIKYIIFYINKPYSAICFYAKIKEYKLFEVDNQKKYRIYFDGKIEKLEHQVKLGDLSSVYARAIRYTTLEKVKKAKEYKDLL